MLISLQVWSSLQPGRLWRIGDHRFPQVSLGFHEALGLCPRAQWELVVRSSLYFFVIHWRHDPKTEAEKPQGGQQWTKHQVETGGRLGGNLDSFIRPPAFTECSLSSVHST